MSNSTGRSSKSAIGRLGLCLIAASVAWGAAIGEETVPVTFRAQVPETTPPASEIYIAGDFQGWNPGSPAHRLKRASDGIYTITIPLKPGARVQFKFTRGHWGVVEKGLRGEEIANRVLSVEGGGIHHFTVAGWANTAASGPTITGDVRRIDVPGFLGGRRGWVYLPPGYDDEPGRRYPVLYMLDGQNVFDQETSFAGEWEVDETCERLISAGEIDPIIVVGIANGETARAHEYTPWPNPARGNVGGGADVHLDAITQTLVPFINREYRTMPAAEHTAFAGSSLGGLMAAYAACTRPDDFGLCAGLSPSVGWADYGLLSKVAASPSPTAKIYLDMGTLEGGGFDDANRNGIDDHIDDLRRLRDALVARGCLPGRDILMVEDEGANHHESFWAERVPIFLRFFFGPSSAVHPDHVARLQPSTEIRVMSFNIRYGTAADGDNSWEHRTDLVRETIDRFDPDLLGTQECLAMQAEYLREAFPEYGFVGVGRDDGHLDGEMCGIFYRRGMFECVDSGHFWLSEAPETIASRSWDTSLTRMATWVRLSSRTDPSRELCFLNTHFDHQGGEARRESAKLICQMIEQLAGDAPCIITGDFNAPADPRARGPYAALMACRLGGESTFTDTYRAQHAPGPREGTFNGFRGTDDGARIDWVLASPPFDVEASEIVRYEEGGRYPSDHFPVTAILQWD